ARPLADLHFHVELAAAALIVEHERRAGLAAGDPGVGVLGRTHGGAIDGEQKIAGLEPGLLPGAVDIEIGDDDTAAREPELLRLRVRDVFGDDSDPAADDAAVLDDVVQHAADHVHRDRKTDAFDAEALGDDGGVDTDQRTAGIHQRAPGIAEIDRRIRLNEILEGGDAELPTGGGADDAVRNRLRESERIADREHDISDPQRIGSAEGDHREARQIDLQDCEIAVRIGAHDLRLRDPTVRELHADGAGVRDHMVVRHDVAALIDDHARSQAALDTLPVLWQHVAEELSERRRIDALRHEARGIYVDYGGGCALHGVRVSHGLRPAGSGLGGGGRGHGRGRRLRVAGPADEI